MPHVQRENFPKALHRTLDEVIQKHHKLWNGDLELFKATEHPIWLEPGAKPVRLKPYRMGHASRELTREQVQLMNDMGIIDSSSSEWASPIVLVPKPDGTVRFCIHNRKLNGRTFRILILHRVWTTASTLLARHSSCRRWTATRGIGRSP